MNREGLCAGVLPVLKRTKAIQKSATAAPGQRPDPETHYDSLSVDPNIAMLPAGSAMTIVDDVITRGATFTACYSRLLELYPAISIRCLALIRTMSAGEVDVILAPVSGRVTYRNGVLHREP